MARRFSLFVLILFSVSTTACQTTSPGQIGKKQLPSTSEVQAELRKSKVPRPLREKIIRLHHEDPVERAWAAYQLGKLGDSASAAVPYLIRLLPDNTPVLLSRYLGGGYHSSSDTTPGQEASRALARIGRQSVDPLIDALKDPDPDVRRHAAKSLGKIGDLKAIDFLIPVLADPDRKVRATAAVAIGQYRHPMASQKLMDAMPSMNASVRADIVYAMAQINDILVVPFLLERLKNEEPNVRAAIVYALGKLRDARAVPSLLKVLTDPDEIIRANAAYALGNYYSVHVVDALVKTLGDPVQSVREAAAEALEKLTGMKFGTDQGKWTAWWHRQKKSIKH